VGGYPDRSITFGVSYDGMTGLGGRAGAAAVRQLSRRLSTKSTRATGKYPGAHPAHTCAS
jgi:hypothetical protein